MAGLPCAALIAGA